MTIPQKKDGGPAFPSKMEWLKDSQKYEQCFKGLTLRQYYKAAALQGIMANSAYLAHLGTVIKEEGVLKKTLSEHCSLIADAMIQEDLDFEKRDGGK